MPDEADTVGADVYPWPGSSITHLDEADTVGADVYPWPGSPMASLDKQIGTMTDFATTLHKTF